LSNAGIVQHLQYIMSPKKQVTTLWTINWSRIDRLQHFWHIYRLPLLCMLL